MKIATDWIINNYIEIFGAVTGIIYVFLEIRQNIWLWPVGIVTSAIYIYVFFTGKLYADMSLQGYYLAISVVGWYWWLKGSGRRAESSEQDGGQRRVGEAEKEKRRGGEGERERGIGSSVSPLEGGEGGVKTGRLRGEETEGQKGPYQGIPSGESLSREAGGEGVGNMKESTLMVSRINKRTGIVLSVIFVLLYSVMWFILDRFTDSPVPRWDSFITSLSIIATWMLARKIYEHWFLWIIINFTAAILFFTRELYPTVALYLIYLLMSFAGLREWKKYLTVDQ